MRVRFLTPMAGPHGSAWPGEVQDHPAEVAAKWIAAGAAIEVSDDAVSDSKTEAIVGSYRAPEHRTRD